MTIQRAQERSAPRRRAAHRARLILCLAAGVALPSAASAWKGATHVFLAEEVREAAVAAGGVVSVGATDFWGQRIVVPGAFGSYGLNGATFEALAGYPAYFRAGALGPDAYPDLLFGQMTIHPEANTLGGADAWLKLLYANANTPQERAFVLGFISHAAADAFGHTFVNSFAGGPWELGANAVKHVVVEGYIDNARPGLRAGSHVIDTADVNGFIYANLIDARRGRNGSPTVLWELMRRTRDESVPGLFTNLRAGLEDFLAGYYHHVAELRAAYNNARENCNDSWHTDAVSCKQMAVRGAKLIAYREFVGLAAVYAEAWVDDITRGLRAWPATSTAVAQAVFMNPRGADWDAASIALSRWKDTYLYSMMGAPDIFQEIVRVAAKLLGLIQPIKHQLDLLERRLFDYLVERATGQSLTEWKSLMLGEGVDQLIPSSTGIATTAQLNQLMALADGKFTPDRFAPAFNSMALIKLSLINDSDDWMALLAQLGWTPDADQLRQYLPHRHYDPAFPREKTATVDPYGFNPRPGWPAEWFRADPLRWLDIDGLLGSSLWYRGQAHPHDQVVIGFIRSLDASNEWEPRGDGQEMLLTRDYALFQRVFMHQRGDCHYDGRCAPNPLPAILSVIDTLLLD